MVINGLRPLGGKGEKAVQPDSRKIVIFIRPCLTSGYYYIYTAHLENSAFYSSTKGCPKNKNTFTSMSRVLSFVHHCNLNILEAGQHTVCGMMMMSVYCYFFHPSLLF